MAVCGRLAGDWAPVPSGQESRAEFGLKLGASSASSASASVVVVAPSWLAGGASREGNS